MSEIVTIPPLNLSMNFRFVTAVIPVLDEEGSIGHVVTGLLQRGVGQVIVADNGSRDLSREVARNSGATVVQAERRGYGSACLVGLAALPNTTLAVLFCDGDGADDLEALSALCEPVLTDKVDLMVGSRSLGGAENGALSWPQRTGNLVASTMLRMIFQQRVTDLGPFRCISIRALKLLGMSDPNFGWTAEMQTKALRRGLRYREVPVRALCRKAGVSKISGCWPAVFRAGWCILSTIARHGLGPSGRSPGKSSVNL